MIFFEAVFSFVRLFWFCWNPDLRDEEKHGIIYGTSDITVIADDVEYKATSGKDGYVGLKVSASAGSAVKIEFGHSLTFKPKSDDDDFTDSGKKFVETYEYSRTNKNGDQVIHEEVTDADGKKKTKNSKTYKWTVNSINNNNPITNDEVREKDITVRATDEDFGSGKIYTTKSICSKIGSYASRLTFDGDDVMYKTNKSTRACVKITFVKDPSGSPKSGSVSGADSTGPMFIGEGSSLNWTSRAIGVPTRRLSSYRATSYLVDPDLRNDTSANVAGNSRYTTNDKLCDHIRSVIGDRITGCGNYKISKSWDTSSTKASEERVYSATDAGGSPTDRTDTASVVVPEQYNGSTSALGAKYCNTMGYKFQYWYAVNKVGGGSSNADGDGWHRVSNKDYWYIFPSACSVIAKRPEVAVWNGSVFAPGGVNTALSQRYADTTMGKLTSDTSKNRVFGSWDEYLIIANGSIKGMASASALANGKTSDKSEQLSVAYNKEGNSNSRLTIQNLIKSTGLGHADISASESYASNISKLATGTDRHEGDFTIDSNIISSGNFATNSLPQRIIYVNGNLKIKSNVERIDAWLLVTGEIDTCSDVTNSNLSSTTCNRPLQFNGPVMAKNIKLRRTNGAENSDAATPAEVFNLRPDAYIWAYHKSIDPGDTGYDYKVVNSRELAPRF